MCGFRNSEFLRFHIDAIRSSLKYKYYSHTKCKNGVYFIIWHGDSQPCFVLMYIISKNSKLIKIWQNTLVLHTILPVVMLEQPFWYGGSQLTEWIYYMYRFYLIACILCIFYYNILDHIYVFAWRLHFPFNN